MPTGLSSTSTATAATYRPHPVVAARRAVADVGHLLRFRAGTVRRRAAVPWTIAIMLGLTVAACTLPMTFPGARTSDRARDVLVLRGGSRVATVGSAEMAGEEGARAYRALLD